MEAAAHSKTRPAGELMNLELGDQVEFYRSPATKDLVGWRGPGTVVDLSAMTDGIIHRYC